MRNIERGKPIEVHSISSSSRRRKERKKARDKINPEAKNIESVITTHFQRRKSSNHSRLYLITEE